MEIATLGIDLSKTTFHIVGLDRRGEIVVRRNSPAGNYCSSRPTDRRC